MLNNAKGKWKWEQLKEGLGVMSFPFLIKLWSQERHYSLYPVIYGRLKIYTNIYIWGWFYFLFKDMCATQVALVVNNLPANAGDVRDAGSIPGSGRIPGGGNGGAWGTPQQLIFSLPIKLSSFTFSKLKILSCHRDCFKSTTCPS